MAVSKKTSAKPAHPQTKPAGKATRLAGLKSLVFGKPAKPVPGAPSKKDAPFKPAPPVLKGKGAPHQAAASASKSKGSKGPSSAPALAPSVAKPAASKAAVAKSAVARSPKPSRVVEDVCREVACEGLATSAGYCRLHYIKNWKKIKRKELILKEGKLNQFIEELVAKYPEKYIEAIRMDLTNDKDFAKVVFDLELDESVDEFEGETEGEDNVVEEIKRDFEDESTEF